MFSTVFNVHTILTSSTHSANLFGCIIKAIIIPLYIFAHQYQDVFWAMGDIIKDTIQFLFRSTTKAYMYRNGLKVNIIGRTVPQYLTRRSVEHWTRALTALG